jgi:hypothetical protein
VTFTGRSRFLTYVPPRWVRILLIWVRRLRSSMPERERVIFVNTGRRYFSIVYVKYFYK